MKKNKLLTDMSLIDEKYVEEARPERLKQKKQSIMRLGALAACICIMVTALSLFMFIPFSTELPDVSAYEGSEYYPIIEKLNVATYRPPVYKNNFQKIFYRLGDLFGAKAEDGDNEPADAGALGSSGYRVCSRCSRGYGEGTFSVRTSQAVSQISVIQKGGSFGDFRRWNVCRGREFGWCIKRKKCGESPCLFCLYIP